MEFLEAFESFINSCGFPIACCAVMFYQNSKLQKTLEDVKVTMALLVERLEGGASNEH